ncbi:MAG: hypothetical protein E2O61_03920 [Gammaproteobacteria bacterium]|nr:MAG: hypothetical protein E2O59_06305 [Gammaproteobacteria bacterium]TDJ38698.1 MAG: hypothetical protein E2O61_03920 [Gammaproteobacteria bacterium]
MKARLLKPEANLKFFGISLALLLIVAAPLTHGAASGPVVRLFPTTVLEDIRETGQVAEEMENNLQQVIHRLDMQQQLFEESLCQGADSDQGCARISKQLGATYLEMLNVMSERLPEMVRAVNRTRSSLEKRLRQELGQRMTPTLLQNALLGENNVRTTSRPELRGRSGVRLSDRFKQYYQLVATHREGPGKSLAVVAADIYLDMEEAAQLLAATQEEISRASLMEQLNQSFGLITPEMANIVNGVKEILFGEAANELPIASPPYVIGQTDFVSPLQM